MTRVIVLLSLCALALACASTGSTRSKSDAMAAATSAAERRAELVTNGKQLWSRCQSCHGRDGRADTAFGRSMAIPDFSQVAWQKSRETNQLITTIREGGGGVTESGQSRMPAQTSLTDDEVRALVAYVRSLQN